MSPAPGWEHFAAILPAIASACDPPPLASTSPAGGGWLRAENASTACSGISDAGWSTFVPRSCNRSGYHQQMFEFHSSLTNSHGYHHPWESKPWQWIANIRPLLYYYESGCRTDERHP
ncbi:MAG: hypothetical protein U1U88_000587 [Lawsonella clevelandensis]